MRGTSGSIILQSLGSSIFLNNKIVRPLCVFVSYSYDSYSYSSYAYAYAYKLKNRSLCGSHMKEFTRGSPCAPVTTKTEGRGGFLPSCAIVAAAAALCIGFWRPKR